MLRAKDEPELHLRLSAVRDRGRALGAIFQGAEEKTHLSFLRSLSDRVTTDSAVPIRLQKHGTGWVVSGEGVSNRAVDLDWAAFDALFLAEVHGTTVELGEGVPGDALELGRKLRERWNLR